MGADLAYDPLVQEMVLFGGCGAVCPTNSTWTYDGVRWTNLTASLAGEADGLPAAMNGTALAWDPQRGGVLLTGGVYPSGAASSATWLWDGSGWHLLTSTVDNASNGSLAAPDEGYGAMAYDGALHEMVVVNGCSSATSGCPAGVRGATFALGKNGSTWTDLGASFHLGSAYPGPVGGEFGAAMAYDPTEGELVYFGGEDAAGTIENATWIMNATGWYNVTLSAAGCDGPDGACTSHFYPQNGSAFGGMTWDGQLGEVVLVGGLTAAAGRTNETAAFVGGAWYPLCTATCAAGQPAPEDASALASNSSLVAPLLVEGECAAPSHCAGDDWVFEVPPEPAVSSVLPRVPEAGVAVHVTVSDTAGTGSGPTVVASVNDTDHHAYVGSVSGVTFSEAYGFTTEFTYSSPGTYSLRASITDYFTVVGSSPAVPLTVNASVEAAPTATPNPTEAGAPVAFAPGTTAGAPPYTYLWNFGDDNTSTEAAPAHTYTTAGTYDGWLIVTDNDSVAVNASFTVTVYPTLTAEISTEGPATDVAVELLFAGRGAGGTGSYSHYAWDFGDKNTSAAPITGHSYSTAGRYTIRFTVTDSAGFEANVTTTLQVNPVLSVSSILASSLTPTTGTDVTFNVTARNGTPVYAYLWTFPDGSTATGPVARHTFLAAGAATVSVTVADAVGDRVTKKLQITVSSRPSNPGLLGSLARDLGPYGLVGGLVAASALLVVLVWLRPRRADPSPGTDSGTPGPSAGGPGSPPPPEAEPAPSEELEAER